MDFLKKIVSVLKGDSLLGHVSVLTIGTLIGHLATLAGSPILTRIYTPEAFGTFGVIFTGISLLAIFSTFRFELAIPLAKKEEEGFHLVILCGWCLLFFCLILCVAIPVIKAFHIIEGLDRISYWMLIFFPLGCFVVGVYNTLVSWAIRARNFWLISQTKCAQSIGIVAGQLILGFLDCRHLGLVWGDVLGRCLGISSLLKSLWAQKYFQRFDFPDMRQLISVAKTYKDFPMKSLPDGISDKLNSSMPIFLFSAFINNSASGFFFFANSLLVLPSVLLGHTLSQVYLPRFVEHFQTGTLAESVSDVLDSLTQLAVIPFCIAAVLSLNLVSLIFGESWAPASWFIVWLAIPSCITFIFSPLSQVFTVTRRFLTALLYRTCNFFFRLGGFFLGYYWNKDYIVPAYAIMAALAGITGISIILFIAKVKTHVIYKNLLLLLFSWGATGLVVTYGNVYIRISYVFLLVAIFFFITIRKRGMREKRHQK